MENYNSIPFGNNDNEKKPQKKLNSNRSKIMDIDTFEDGVRKGLYSDTKGTAYLILNGTLYNTYNVYIDTRRITKAGAVVSFESIFKTYGKDQIAIRFDFKESRLRGRKLL